MIANRSGLRVTASGGVSSLNDIDRLQRSIVPGIDSIIIGRAFHDGIFTATNTNGDSGVELNVPTPVDPSRFYYATYRMRVHGPQDIGAGSVSRWHWSYGPNFPLTYSTLWSSIVYEGWQTVTIDMRTAPLEPCSERR